MHGRTSPVKACCLSAIARAATAAVAVPSSSPSLQNEPNPTHLAFGFTNAGRVWLRHKIGLNVIASHLLNPHLLLTVCACVCICVCANILFYPVLALFGVCAWPKLITIYIFIKVDIRWQALPCVFNEISDTVSSQICIFVNIGLRPPTYAVRIYKILNSRILYS